MADEGNGQVSVATVSSEVIKLRVQREKFRTVIAALTSERDTYKAESERLKQQNDDLQKRTDSSALSKRVASLEQEIRTRDHKAVFESQATAKGVRSDAHAALWKHVDYKADGDPDEENIGAIIDNAKETAPFFFGEAKEPPAAKKPGPAKGKGTGSPSDESQFGMLDENDPRWSDVKWQYENFDKISAAAKDRIARGQV
jgi:hypothetical protein